MKSIRGGFNLVELLVVITLIVLLMALLFPAILASRRTVGGADCRNNLANVGKTWLALEDDLRRRVVGPKLNTYLDLHEENFRCPDNAGEDPGDYGVNVMLDRLTWDSKVLAVDSSEPPILGQPMALVNVAKRPNIEGLSSEPDLKVEIGHLKPRHDGRINVAFTDGHTESMLVSTIDFTDDALMNQWWMPADWSSN